MAHHNNPGGLSLLDLTAETRLRIFKYAFHFDEFSGRPIEFDCKEFQSLDHDFRNTSCVSKQIRHEVESVFYDHHPITLDAIATVPTGINGLQTTTRLLNLDSMTTIVYGRPDFYLQMPGLTARAAVRTLKLRLLPPRVERDDEDWTWEKVQGERYSSDFLWPIINLHELGFSGLKTLVIVFEVTSHRDRNSMAVWDRMFIATLKYVVERMMLVPKPIITWKLVFKTAALPGR